MINVNKGENGKTLMFLRSINDSHSAYCEVVFDQDFFDTVKVRSTVNENPDDSDDEYAEDYLHLADHMLADYHRHLLIQIGGKMVGTKLT